ncbi:MAG: RnfABCDGE type electron transport complex subunit G [Rhodocyclaceae bacterium]|nr:RnfABCDGE type electron transport complex subunit G [Rhodocyclaceae bacterium]
MAFTYDMIKPILDASAQAQRLKLIGEVLPPTLYDNDLLADTVTLPATPALGLDEPSLAYRARMGGEPVALVFEAGANNGYSGRIGLVLAVLADGRLRAVRVSQYKETPVFGDYIDPKKDKNKSNPVDRAGSAARATTALGGHWKVKKDGGRFDARAGATISARAVTNASGKALIWIAERRDALFALPSGAALTEKTP